MRDITKIATLLLIAITLTACDALRPIPQGQDDLKIVEVAIFEGGYGIEWHQAIAQEFNRDHADQGVRIKLWGDPRTADIIKPRLLRGDPPDMILDERLPIWLLIAAQKLRPFGKALDASPPGSDQPWGDLFADGMLDMFRSGDEVYALPAAYGAWACWYDAALFRKHGWEVPTTWAAFTTLCQAIQAQGIAPIALQGKYPSFYGWNTYIAIVQRVGGLQAINRINALAPDAFSHPDAIEAARIYQDLVLNYFQRGAMAMTHTESQLQFVNGKAAMIFCGIWLENEMKDSMPPGVELKCFDLPRIKGGKGNPTLFHGQGMEYIFIPTDARYPDYAFEFARYLISPKFAPNMGATIGVISPLKNGTPRDSVSPALQSVLTMIENADGFFNVRLRELLPEWRAQTMNTAMANLLRGEITPKQFAQQLDNGLTKAKQNPDIIIPPHKPYDPTHYGES